VTEWLGTLRNVMGVQISPLSRFFNLIKGKENKMNDFKMFLAIGDAIADNIDFENADDKYLNDTIKMLEEEKSNVVKYEKQFIQESQRATAFYDKHLNNLKTIRSKRTCVQEKNKSVKPKEFTFPIGTKVKKITGDYTFSGIVIGTFTKLSGLQRYAVEDDRGVIHIYTAKNLALRKD